MGRRIDKILGWIDDMLCALSYDYITRHWLFVGMFIGAVIGAVSCIMWPAGMVMFVLFALAIWLFEGKW